MRKQNGLGSYTASLPWPCFCPCISFDLWVFLFYFWRPFQLHCIIQENLFYLEISWFTTLMLSAVLLNSDYILLWIHVTWHFMVPGIRMGTFLRGFIFCPVAKIDHVKDFTIKIVLIAGWSRLTMFVWIHAFKRQSGCHVGKELWLEMEIGKPLKILSCSLKKI